MAVPIDFGGVRASSGALLFFLTSLILILMQPGESETAGPLEEQLAESFGDGVGNQACASKISQVSLGCTHGFV